MRLTIDHVMFPVYMGGDYLDIAEDYWRGLDAGRVFRQPPGPAFEGLYLQTRSFYVEIAATTAENPYWSNAVYVILPKTLWGAFENPAFASEHFLIPAFGAGYQLVSPDFPYLNADLPQQSDEDGLSILISPGLEATLTTLAGGRWTLPGNVRAHPCLHHAHEMAVVADDGRLVAPALRENPVLRDFLR